MRVITTVVQAATGYALTTVEAVQQELGLPGDPDGYLVRLIARCSAAILRHCNMVEAPEAVRDLFLPDQEPDPLMLPGGVDPLQLGRYPVQSVASVVEAGLPLTADRDYVVDPAAGQLIRLDGDGVPCRWRRAVIAVEYGSGADVPADLEDAAIRLVKARWFARGRDPMLRSESIPGVRDASYWVSASADDGNLPPDVADLLSSYRVPVFG